MNNLLIATKTKWFENLNSFFNNSFRNKDKFILTHHPAFLTTKTSLSARQLINGNNK